MINSPNLNPQRCIKSWYYIQRGEGCSSPSHCGMKCVCVCVCVLSVDVYVYMSARGREIERYIV